MAKTMHWRVVPSVVHIIVHTKDNPSDEDWDAYLADVVQHADTIKGLLVYSAKAGPTASQRSRSNQAFHATGASMRTAIMTGSRVVKGIVTALSWAMGNNIKAFSSHDFDSAVAHLGLDDEEQIRTRVVLRQLARAADQEIDAFADESGHFLRDRDKP